MERAGTPHPSGVYGCWWKRNTSFGGKAGGELCWEISHVQTKGFPLIFECKKMARTASERSFGQHKQSKETNAKKAKTICWQMEKDWEVNGFGEGCPVLKYSTSGWTPVLKGTM